MAQFTVRVELHNASGDQYAVLHQIMGAHGFKRLIAGIDAAGAKGWWQLPTGEYDGESDETAVQVRDRVKIIADSVRPGAWVLVTQVAGRSWNTVKVQSA